MEVENGFGVVDYVVFAGVLVISGGIGLYMSYKGNKSPEEFLMGNRSLQPIPVAMSLLTTFFSAISILGYSGEAYANGIQLIVFLLGATLGITFSSYLILPIIYPLKLTSVNEYILLRFRSPRLRIIISILTLLKFLTLGGITLYAPTLALATITKLSTLSNIFLLGIICTIYSAMGGVRAIIWTDVFQLLVIIIGLLSMIVVGCAHNGGLIETLYIASKGGRLEVFNMSPSPFVRHTFFNTFIFGFVAYSSLYSSDQCNIQRIGAVKSFKNARRVLVYNTYGFLVVITLIFTSGLVAYSTYAGCDPMALGIIKRKDQILPYFVIDKLSFIPGLSGLFVATIIGGSLSSLSSIISACVALLWRDTCLKFNYFKTASSELATLTNKILSLVVGAFLIGLAILSSNTKGLIEITLTICGTFAGPTFGVFLIGHFLPKCNIKGIWTGLIFSTIATLWISLGGMIYKKPTKMLPFSTDECDHLNFTSETIRTSHIYHSLTNSSFPEESTDEMSIMSIYQISYTLYTTIGVLLCILLSLTVSFITGNQKITEVSPKYVSSYVYKFYWTKEELGLIQNNEVNHNSDITKNNEIEI